MPTNSSTPLEDYTGSDRQRKLIKLAELYRMVIGTGKLDASTTAAIDGVMGDLATMVEMTWDATTRTFTLHEQQESSPAPGKRVSKHKSDIVDLTQSQTITSYDEKAIGVSKPLTYSEYARSVRTYLMQQEVVAITATIERNTTRIEQLENPPDTWVGTKKAFLELNKHEITSLRANNQGLRLRLTQFRNGELEYQVADEFDKKIRALYESSGGKLTTEQLEARLKELKQRIFEEESVSENFYPTPPKIVDRMLLAADLGGGELTVLEPSAGKGDIANAIRKDYLACRIDVIELNDIRAEYLQLTGYNLVGRDTLEYEGAQYDRIVMNPPFDRVVGLTHVEYCFDKLLKVGGKLVALLPASSYGNETQLDSVKFRKNYVDKYGTFEGIRPKEYNEGNERQITINVSIITLTKPADFYEERTTDTRVLSVTVGDRVRNKMTQGVATVTRIYDEENSGQSIQMIELAYDGGRIEEWPNLHAKRFEVWSHTDERIALPDRTESMDTSYVTPEIVTARAELTGQVRKSYIDRSRLSEQIKPYVVDGADYIIDTLTNNGGGFLLADGTGTGKTIQQLLIATHFVESTGKPFLIFTESDQIIQQSFFGDALKLGMIAPDRKTTEVMKAKKAKNYKGLYDDYEYGATPTLCDDDPLRVIRFRPEVGLQPGINIGTYHDLSNLHSLKDHPAEMALKKAKREFKEMQAQYKEEADSAKKNYKGRQLVVIKDRIKHQLENDPRNTAVIAAEDAWIEAQGKILHPWVTEASGLCYDEAHNLKNSGKGGAQRATRATFLSENAPVVLFVSATPADKAGDVEYLKRAGLYETPEQFKRLMMEIGFFWDEERRNEKGEVIKRGEYRLSNTYPIDAAMHGLARIFDRLTEDRKMLKREISLVNLEGVTMIDVPVDEHVHSTMKEIHEILAEEAAKKDRLPPIAQILMEQKRYLEPYKIDTCIELVRKEIGEGRSVVIFCDLVDEGEEDKPWGAPKAGVVKRLKERLSDIFGSETIGLVIGVSGAWETEERIRQINDFQTGKKRIMIATVGSGGTGISLDDTIGNAPRTIIMMTAPMNSIKTVQVMGRVIRANTRSRSRAYFLFADIDIDIWLKNLLATKLKMLNAMVSGQVSLLTPQEVTAIEAGGDDGAAAQFETTAQNDRKPHSLAARKENTWIDGRTMPQGMDLQVQHYNRYHYMNDGRGGEIWIKSSSSKNLAAFAKQYSGQIAQYGFQKESDRYQGSYYKTAYSPEVHTWALNLIKYERSDVPVITSQIFSVGEKIRTVEDILSSHTKAGTTGVILAVRPRTGYWLYDVKFDDGTNALSIDQERLESLEFHHDYRVGQVYEASTYYGSYKLVVTGVSDDSIEYTFTRTTGSGYVDTDHDDCTPDQFALKLRADNYALSVNALPNYEGSNALADEHAVPTGTWTEPKQEIPSMEVEESAPVINVELDTLKVDAAENDGTDEDETEVPSPMIEPTVPTEPSVPIARPNPTAVGLPTFKMPSLADEMADVSKSMDRMVKAQHKKAMRKDTIKVSREAERRSLAAQKLRGE